MKNFLFLLLIGFFGFNQGLYSNSRDSLISAIDPLPIDTQFDRLNNLAADSYTLDDMSFWGQQIVSRAKKEENNYWHSMGLHYLASVQTYLGNPDSAITLRKDAINRFSKINRKDKMARQYSIIGNLFADLSKFDSSIYYYNIAIDLAIESKDTVALSGTLVNLSTVFHERGDKKKELELLMRSLNLNKLTKNDGQIATILNNLAIFYIEEKNYAQAKKLGAEALNTYDKIYNQKGKASVYTLFAKMQLESGEIDSALYYLDQAEIALKSQNDYSRLSSVYLNQGQVLGDAGRYEEALMKLKLALSIFQQMGQKSLVSKTLRDIASIEYTNGNLTIAIDLIEEAIEIADSLETLNDFASWNKDLAQLYYETKAFKLAYDKFLIYDFMNDSIKKINDKEIIGTIEAKFQNEKKQLEIEKLESDKALKEAKIVKQNSQRTMMIGGLSLSALIILIVSVAFFSKRKDNQIIGKQKNLVELKNSELNLQKDIVEEKNREITDSIIYAKRIQEAILPPKELFEKSLGEGFVLYIPKSIVAGDFYWMNHHSDSGVLLFAAADCTGHGVPGALVSVVCSNALNQATKEFKLTKPSEILSKTREIVIEHFSKSSDEVKDGMDIAFCSFNAENKMLEFAGAQNPLWIVRNGELNYQKLNSSYKMNISDEVSLFEIKGDKQPIGVYDVNTPFTNHKIQLQKGDSVYLFSDGFADQFGGINGKKLKYKGFKDLILAMHNEPMQNQNERIQKAFYDWKGDLEQLDDICVIGMKIG